MLMRLEGLINAPVIIRQWTCVGWLGACQFALYPLWDYALCAFLHSEAFGGVSDPKC